MEEKKAKIEISRPKERQPMGLQDHGTVDIACADCGEILMEFLIVQTNEELSKRGLDPMSCKVMVRCGLCNGKSYIQEVHGQFYPGTPSDEMSFEPTGEKIDGCDFVFKAWK